MSIETLTDKPTLWEAMRFLAARCDGAYSRDSQGFNKFDSDFGMKLAFIDERDWSQRQSHAAWRMLKKYSGQLEGGGIDYTAITEPPAPGSRNGTTAVSEQERADLYRLELDGDRLRIMFPYDPNVVVAVRQLPGRKFHGDVQPKHWSIPVNLEVIDPLRDFVREHRQFALADDARDLLKSIADAGEQSIAASYAADADIDLPPLGGELRPFQRAGVKYALDKRRTFIADEMGLGKTIEALATVAAADAYPAIVVCPATVKLNWYRETLKWLPGKLPTVVMTKRAKVSNWGMADVIIVNYDLIGVKRLKRGEKRDFAGIIDGSATTGSQLVDGLMRLKPKAVIFDESHYAKNYKAQRTEGARVLAHGVDIRLALTGTPVLNRPGELMTQLSIIDRLDDLGGFWHFMNHYVQPFENTEGLSRSAQASLQELNKKMRALCFIRRAKSEVLTELPDKQRSFIPIELSNRSEYGRAERDLIAWLIETKGMEKASKAQSAEQLVRISELKQLAAHGKLKAAIEWVNSFLETGEKLVVFAEHIAVQDALIAAFPGCASLQGADAAKKRQANVDRFQDRDDCRLIVCSMRAGGVGITLTSASNVGFIELGWNPAAHDQAEDRCHRIGQHDNVTAWYLLAPDTIDERIFRLIENKRVIVTATTEGKAVEDDIGILNELVAELRGEVDA